MKECAIVSCNNTNIVYSGSDAFILGGVPTELYCYTCAAAYMQISNHMASLVTIGGND